MLFDLADVHAEAVVVYILASKPWGTLYAGVTSDIEARAFQHRQGLFDGITNYDAKTPVHFEEPALATMRASIGNFTKEKLSAAP